MMQRKLSLNEHLRCGSFSPMFHKNARHSVRQVGAALIFTCQPQPTFFQLSLNFGMDFSCYPVPVNQADWNQV
jgi:hypothetical protein